MSTETPFALDQYAATSCPVKTQNTFSLSTVNPTDGQVVEDFRGSTHRLTVMRHLLKRHENDIIDMSTIADPTQRTTAAIQAMTEGVPIIVNACLPVDWMNHRRGTVDILLQADDEGAPRYHPVILKDHPVLAANSSHEGRQLITHLTKPFFKHAHGTKYSFRVDSRSEDLLQLAHLWFLLSLSGFATEQPWGGVLGTDHEESHGSMITWVNLSQKLIRAFSYTSTHQWKKYSPLSRYQHEHRFRVRVATHALMQEEDRELVASPVHIPECENCEWWPECQMLLTDDISLKIERSQLDAREIMTLRSLGISTINDLASTDVEALLPEYLPKVAHRAGADTRLRLAARRGRLLEAGITLERLTTGPIDLPSAEVEIDLDIETSANNHAYLWGFLVDDRRTNQEPYYHSIDRFALLTQSKELELGEEAASWLMEFIESLGNTSVLVWHYSHYEISTLQRLARSKRQPLVMLSKLAALSRHSFIDLLPCVTDNFFGVEGLGLKTVATVGAGFSWRDPEASGLNSQFWFADAIRPGNPEAQEAAKDRILKYNEDDVRATWTLRRWLRSLT